MLVTVGQQYFPTRETAEAAAVLAMDDFLLPLGMTSVYSERHSLYCVVHSARHFYQVSAVLP